MKKVISYTLFAAKNPNEYIKGLLAAKELLGELYPDWTIRVYTCESIDKRITDIFEKWNWEVIPVTGHVGSWIGVWWRLLPIWDETVDIVSVGEADTLPTYTYRKLLNIFEQLDKNVMGRVDVYPHTTTMYGGFLVFKRKGMEKIRSIVSLEEFHLSAQQAQHIGAEEYWMYNTMYPIIKDDFFDAHVQWQDGFEGWRDNKYYTPPIIPPVDSSLIRHNLIKITRNQDGHGPLDNIWSYYSDCDYQPVTLSK